VDVRASVDAMLPVLAAVAVFAAIDARNARRAPQAAPTGTG
jgi:hypothetical protein